MCNIRDLFRLDSNMRGTSDFEHAYASLSEEEKRVFNTLFNIVVGVKSFSFTMESVLIYYRVPVDSPEADVVRKALTHRAPGLYMFHGNKLLALGVERSSDLYVFIFIYWFTGD